MLRTDSRVDANQPAIIAALRAVGASVLHCHQLKNCFDILVGYRGHTFLMEIKVSKREPLTPGETEFRRTWCGTPQRRAGHSYHHHPALNLMSARHPDDTDADIIPQPPLAPCPWCGATPLLLDLRERGYIGGVRQQHLPRHQ